MDLNASNGLYGYSQRVSLSFKDISLERLYGVLYCYCCLYSDYSFNIVRYPGYYLLTFKAWGDIAE